MHYKFLFLETIRVPIAVVSTTVFPALSLMFFVIPQGDLASEPVIASAAAAQLSVFAIMSVCLFTFGAGIAEDRATPWDPYLRTLPASPGPRVVGRLLNGLTFAAMGLVPLLLLAATLTEATLPIGRIVPAMLAWVAACLPFLGLGLAIGYRLSSKAALAVANVLLLPLAFGGGLFLPPQLFPGWLVGHGFDIPAQSGRPRSSRGHSHRGHDSAAEHRGSARLDRTCPRIGRPRLPSRRGPALPLSRRRSRQIACADV